MASAADSGTSGAAETPASRFWGGSRECPGANRDQPQSLVYVPLSFLKRSTIVNLDLMDKDGSALLNLTYKENAHLLFSAIVWKASETGVIGDYRTEWTVADEDYSIVQGIEDCVKTNIDGKVQYDLPAAKRSKICENRMEQIDKILAKTVGDAPPRGCWW